uniref:PGF-CTERM sorting domain-containing protein n=2 Tax=prokaryotic environmental samples TaxID=81490 RepID=B3T3W6_9ZZZZ|nr:hypothetical protein ALOHA_HF4000ANIW133F6ctg1g25 [uncultured marine microorganism HF4000_ANIW133F6]
MHGWGTHSISSVGTLFPSLPTSQTMRNKSIPCILSTVLLIAVLMAPLASAESENETITVNHVVLVDTPPHKEWSWNYSYQVEVSDLQMDMNYTAVIDIVLLEDTTWGGLDWWWDIDWEGGYDEDNDGYHNQFNFTFSLQSGCYHMYANLYDRAGDIENSAPIGSTANFDFGVGGICEDGVFYSIFDSDGDGLVGKQDLYCPDTPQGEMVDEHGCSESDYARLSGTGGDDDEAARIPGFGLLLSITAALGAALIATRRE